DHESVREEVHEAPESHDLTPSQAERIQNLSDEDIVAAINAEVDDHFWAAYDDVRRRTISRLAGDPLVCVVFLQGQDYEDAVDAANNLGGSTEAVVAHLSQWDYGDENDAAAEVNGYTERTDLERLRHQLHEVDHG